MDPHAVSIVPHVVADTGFGAPWSVLVATVAVSATMYASVLVATRVAGRRTIAELSAFDAVVTVAVGTMLGSVAISSQISYAEGITATLTLFALQVAVGAIRSHVPRTRRLLDFEPVTVVRDGQAELPHGPFGSQLTIDELRSQLRRRGVGDIGSVELAVLEPIGGVSVSSQSDDVGVRSTEDVLDDHLRRLRAGDLDGDLSRNYDDDVVVVTGDGVSTGTAAVRDVAARLRSYEPGRLRIDSIVAGPGVGVLRWRVPAPDGDAAPGDVEGFESYVVRAGRIVAQTVREVPPTTCLD